MTTKVKTQFEKDFQIAQEELNAYAELKNEKATIDASMKEAKSKLEAFGKKYRNKFDEKGNLKMEGGYLKFGDEAKVVLNEKKFKPLEFLRSFPKLVKFDFRIADLKKALTSGDTRKSIEAHGVDMTFDSKFDIKLQDEKE